MRVMRSDPQLDKGWFAGPWNSDLTVSIGYANRGIDEPHFHNQITEIYLVAQGICQMRVEQVTIELSPGDMVIIKPGEAHTFLSSSPEYFHFVVHLDGVAGEAAGIEKIAVSKQRLGLMS